MIRVPRRVIDAIRAHARKEAPRECCGVLLGRGVEITDGIETRNLADAPTRYLIDPRDHLAAIRIARSRGLEIVGFYHSHPHSPAVPSPRDLAEANDRESIYLIVSLSDELPDVRLFRLQPERFEELEYEVVEGQLTVES